MEKLFRILSILFALVSFYTPAQADQTSQMIQALSARVEALEQWRIDITGKTPVIDIVEEEPEIVGTPIEWWLSLFEQSNGTKTPFVKGEFVKKDRYGVPYLEWQVNGKKRLLGKYFDPRSNTAYRKYFDEFYKKKFGNKWFVGFSPPTTKEAVSITGLKSWAFSCGEKHALPFE